MKALVVVTALFLSAGAFAQRANHSVGTNSGFGNVLFPAGKPTIGHPFTLIGPSFGRPGVNGGNGVRNFGGSNRGNSVIYVPYAFPAYGGYGGYGYGYGYDAGYGSGYGYGEGAMQPSPNVTIVMAPPQQQNPVIVMGSGMGQPADVPHFSIQDVVPPAGDTTSATGDSTYYLLAFKDHSVYSAVGYWVDGDTLHYITGGNVHNQVSLALVDRDLTAQLNKGRGVQVNLPPSK